ncbi:hypothetical protein ACP4OV_007817 [Aristida adscensionis]
MEVCMRYARIDSLRRPDPPDRTPQQLRGSRRRARSFLRTFTTRPHAPSASSAEPKQSTITGSTKRVALSVRCLRAEEEEAAAAAAMEPLEVAITIIFDALLLVFMVKLFFAMFQMKLVVILFYLVILLFAMAFSGRAPSSF